VRRVGATFSEEALRKNAVGAFRIYRL